MSVVLPAKIPARRETNFVIKTNAATSDSSGAPDLDYFRRRYPLTVANFGALADREAWLRRVWEADARWQQHAQSSGKRDAAAEVIVRGAPPAGAEIEGVFDVIYAGGAFGLLHAAALACGHDRRVLVFDAGEVGRSTAAGRVWNVSGEELKELESAGLFTPEEIEGAVTNRRRGGFVKFHDAASRVKAERLWVDGVLDVAVDADKLLARAAAKMRARDGCATMSGMRFVRCHVEPHRVTVEVENVRTHARKFFAARLFVDATGADSLVARQLGAARAATATTTTTTTHVCPSVGTIASGYARGAEPDEVDSSVGEIFVSTEDASQHRQLMWEGFAGDARRDDYATRLFFYDAVDSPADKSLLGLFERYFESLPAYKRRGAQWRVRQPLFGHTPLSLQHGGWRGGADSLLTSDDRVLVVASSGGGESGHGAAGSPLTFSGVGTQLRRLRRETHLTALALRADLLDARALAEINFSEPRVARVSGLAEFLRPAPKSQPSAVNETLNAVMAALHNLDERVRRELFQDRLTLGGLKSLLNQTARLYPRIFQRAREHLGARGTFWWLASIAAAFLNERRARADADTAAEGFAARQTVAGDATGDAAAQEEAAREFARCAAVYKNGGGAGGCSQED